ncbi:MAG: TonB-dependent receptor [Alphaproteobacteria bacterium]|nr:TonB-dependent receptor [Alphaproteobacteria bacterium]
MRAALLVTAMLGWHGAVADAQTATTTQTSAAATPAGTTSVDAQAAATPPAVLPEVEVTAPSPLIGTTLDRNKVPSAVNTLTGNEVVRTGIPDFLGALDENITGVSLNNAGGNPNQPAVVYHGFSASPLEGASQGLAVYVNGARFNQPFGDTVNWDLIPSIAIDRVNLEGANPVFGLNALGGSINVLMKNGFTYHGAEASVYGGQYGLVGGYVQWGREKNGTSTYVALSMQNEQGWRDQTSSRLRQLYADLGWRGNAGEAHISITGAMNTLNQAGTVPVELLNADRSAVFTGPSPSYNNYISINGRANYDVSDSTSLQFQAYYQNFSQRLGNGNTPDFDICEDNPGFLCEDDGETPLTNRTGSQITNFLQGGPYSQYNTTAVDTNGYGASLQAVNDSQIFGRSNKLIVGASFDGGVSMFDGNTLAGGFNPDNGDFIGPGVSIDQADGAILPVRVRTTNAYYGIYASDVYNLTQRLSFTLSGRFNAAEVDLADQTGTALTGNHYYTHFNPGVGVTYKVLSNVSAYFSYSVANRAPTPAELSCASEASPCTLANFFVGDPDLKQPIAQTFEAGLRGVVPQVMGGKIVWDVDLYRTNTEDDLTFAPSTLPGLDFFQNIGPTRRQGVDLSANLLVGRWSVYVGYSLTDATFQAPLTLDSGLNPAANANGQIFVQPGDHLPGIPLQQGKVGLDVQITPKWTAGTRMIAAAGQYFFGDEANLTPTTGAYFIVNANTAYQLFPHVQLFAILQNMFNVKYANYGTFSDVTAVPNTLVPNMTNTRSLSPGDPISAYGGVKVTF